MNAIDQQTLQWMEQQAQAPAEDNRDFSPEEVQALVNQAQCHRLALTRDAAWSLVEDFRGTRGGDEQDLIQTNVLVLSEGLAAGLEPDIRVWLSLCAHVLLIDGISIWEPEEFRTLLDQVCSILGRKLPFNDVDEVFSTLEALVEHANGLTGRRAGAASALAVGLAHIISGRLTSAMDIPQGVFSNLEFSRPDLVRSLRRWVWEQAQSLLAWPLEPEQVEFLMGLACRVLPHLGNYSLINGQIANEEVEQWFEGEIRPLLGLVRNHPGSWEYHYHAAKAEVILRRAHALITVGDHERAWGLTLDLMQSTEAKTKLEWEHLPSSIKVNAALLAAVALACLGNLAEAKRLLVKASASLDNKHMFFRGLVEWALGRLELSDEESDSGIQSLGSAVSKMGHAYDSTGTLFRCLLLLTDIETQRGNVGNVDPFLAALESDYSPFPRFLEQHRSHISVILAEARLAKIRNQVESDEEAKSLLQEVSKLLAPLITSEDPRESLAGSSDYLLPRALSASGEVALRMGDYPLAARRFGHALGCLGAAVDAGRLYQDGLISPYWRRPWDRAWRGVAEMALCAELELRQRELGRDREVDQFRAERAFRHLQMLKQLTQSDAIAGLAGFRPELAITREEFAELTRLRANREQTTRQLASRSARLQQIEARLDELSNDAPAKVKLLEEFRALIAEFEHKKSELSDIDGKVRAVEVWVKSSRGFLTRPGWMLTPPVQEVKEQLKKLKAVGVELVHIAGSRWGLKDRWVVFVATAAGIRLIDLLPHQQEELGRQIQWLNEFGIRADVVGNLSRLLLRPLPRQVYSGKTVFFAPDLGAWQVPFHALWKPRWWFLPWLLTDVPFLRRWSRRRLDEAKQVTTVISTSHLLRLCRQTSLSENDTGVAIGGAIAGDPDRRWCAALAKSVAGQPSGDAPKRWEKSVETMPPLEGDFALLLGSWHTVYTDSRHSIAEFYIGDKPLSFADFLSQCRIRSPIVVLLSCKGIAVPEEQGEDGGEPDQPEVRRSSAFRAVPTVALGMLESLRASVMVSTAFDIDKAEYAFVLGRFLQEGLGQGKEVHRALRDARRSMRRATAQQVAQMMAELKESAPELEDLGRAMTEKAKTDPGDHPYDAAKIVDSFFIMGLPGTSLATSGQARRRWRWPFPRG